MLLPAARNRGGSAPSVRPLAPRRCRRPPALLSPPLPAGLRLNRNGPGAYRSPRAPPTGPAGPEPFAGAGRGEAGDGPARPGPAFAAPRARPPPVRGAPRRGRCGAPPRPPCCVCQERGRRARGEPWAEPPEACCGEGTWVPPAIPARGSCEGRAADSRRSRCLTPVPGAARSWVPQRGRPALSRLGSA